MARLFPMTLAVLALLPIAGSAAAQTLVPSRWITDGAINAIACTDRTVYLGGYFTVIAPLTGSRGAEVSLGKVARIRSSPTVRGEVTTAISDQSGGWFIAGALTEVGDAMHQSLAHIRANGSVDAWNPSFDGAITGLLYRQGVLYVCGGFHHINGIERWTLGALDARTGIVTPWDPAIEGGHVDAIALDGSTLYVGGIFDAVLHQPRSHIAAVDATTGRLTNWAPRSDPGIRSIAVGDSLVYVTGDFRYMNWVPRPGLAAFDRTTGALANWSPSGVSGSAPRMLLDRGTLYLWGPVDVGYEGRTVVALDARTGTVRDWNPRPNGLVRALAIKGNDVMLGGDFTHLGSALRPYAGAVDATTGAPLPWTPAPTAKVEALAVDHGAVYVGGNFRGIGGLPRHHLAALDAVTGDPTGWDPHPTRPPHPNPWVDGGIQALALRGSRLYVGGFFDSIAGVTQSYCAAFDARSGDLLPWDPHADDMVSVIEPTDSVLYVEGGFHHIGGSVRYGIAAVRADDGLATEWQPRTTMHFEEHGDVPLLPIAMAVSDGLVYLGGSFQKVNGVAQPYLAAVDPGIGGLMPWTPAGTSIPVIALAAAGDRVIAGRASDCAAFDIGTGEKLWNAVGRSTEVLSIGRFVYRANTANDDVLESLLASNGLPAGWQSSLHGYVSALATNGVHLYAGGLFDQVDGTECGNIVRYLLPGTVGSLAALQSAATGAITTENTFRVLSPIHGDGRFQFALARAGRATIDVFDVEGRRVATALNHEWLPAGEHDFTVATSSWCPGVYLCRFDADGRVITRRMVIVR